MIAPVPLGVVMGVLVRYRWFVLAGVTAVVAALVAVVVWWSRPEPAQPRERAYREFDVCLLTPGAGLAEVLATDPGTGESTAQTVTALHRNEDTELTDVTVSPAPAEPATTGEGDGERSLAVAVTSVPMRMTM